MDADIVPFCPEGGGGGNATDQSGTDGTRATDSLLERGIDAVFDPKPKIPGGMGKAGATGGIDLKSLSAEELRQFLVTPVQKGFCLECRIVRNRSGLNKLYPKYSLQVEATGQHLMSSKKRSKNKTSHYVITTNPEAKCEKDDDSYLGKLRSNFVGSEFVVYGRGINPKKVPPGTPAGQAITMVRPEHAGISYTSTLWGKKPRGPRRMQVVLPHVTSLGEVLASRPLSEDTGLAAEARKAPTNGNGDTRVDQYHNKPPKWNEQIGAFVLNFNKRVTLASVKNFQLVTHDESDHVYLQFGRVGKEVFSMDVRFPLSPLQAFAVSLSSFDYKLCCE